MGMPGSRILPGGELMKRSFWALPLCAIAVGAFVMSAGAQRGGKGPGGGFPGPGGGPSDPGTPAPVVDQPFTLGKRTWPSKAAWIAAGGYCSTPVPSNESVLAVEAELAAAKKGAKRGGGVGPGRFGVRAAARTVNVYFHIIMDSAGNGDISDADLQASIDHMNTAFAGQQARNPFKISAQETGDVPFRYRIAGIERVTNDTWYVIGDEIGMKTALRVGGAADLNIYTGDLGNTGALGWSWFPFWYAGFEFYDGIVMEKEAMIGGNYTGYNEGDVLVH